MISQINNPPSNKKQEKEKKTFFCTQSLKNTMKIFQRTEWKNIFQMRKLKKPIYTYVQRHSLINENEEEFNPFRSSNQINITFTK